MQILNRTLCVAPMMDWTDRHCRYFHRLLAPDALLYTEMVTTGALIHGDRERHLVYNEEEHPVALQLGGSDPADLARCAVMAREYGYDEVNLNVGCPSDRVQKGRFGACLMLEPALVRDCIAAMREAVEIPVTVKSRLGVDQQESYAFFSDFIGQVAESGCQTFIVHARKAWLSGLSPKQNREVPPLHYDRVLRLKDEHPEFEIIVNGGIATVDEAQRFLEVLDGAMIGRAAYQEPWLLARLQRALFGREGAADREQIVRDMTAYLERHVAAGLPVKHVSRHLLGLFQGLPGAKRWRRYISEHAHVDPGNTRVLLEALGAMQSVRRGSAFVHGDGLE